MVDVVIRGLERDDVARAAQILARSMRDNPMHQRVFGNPGPGVAAAVVRTLERLLRRQLVHGTVLGAFDGTALVGVVGMVPSRWCQPDVREAVASGWILARSGGWRAVPRIAQVVRAWGRRDPRCPHWHLGPAAVRRDRQGQGVGTQLMGAVCAGLDRSGVAGYLETDKPENVRLYRRGGFEVIAEARVLGVPNWFMLRPAKASRSRSAPA